MFASVGFDRTVVPAPRPGLFLMDCGDPGLKPGATIHTPYRGRGPRR